MESKTKRNSRHGDRLKKPRWDISSLPQIVKNFYREHPTVSKRNVTEIEKFRNSRDIHVKGRNVLTPVLTFDEANFPAYILQILKSNGFSTPTPIQSQAWPVALAGRDLVAIAETGSGKTLGYILPGIVHSTYQPFLAPEDGPAIVILVPTRELAIQVHSVCVQFQAGSRMNSVCVYGGVAKKPQIRLLERGADIVVATPGRLLDFLEFRQISLKRCSYLVLDEADRMLDLGMAIPIGKIIEQIRPDRQVLMWTATWPEDVQSLAEVSLRDYIQVTIGDSNLSSNRRIRQLIDVCREEEKTERINRLLIEIFSEREDSKVLIFCDTKRRVEYLTKHLRREDWPAKCIHGDKEQLEREWVMQDFRNGDAPILVATDVASRGLDIKNIKYVINYDFPNSVENYVHRIGRTARASSTGTAYTFITGLHAKFVIPLIGVLKVANQKVPLDLIKMADEYSIERSGRRFNAGDLINQNPDKQAIDTEAKNHVNADSLSNVSPPESKRAKLERGISTQAYNPGIPPPQCIQAHGASAPYIHPTSSQQPQNPTSVDISSAAATAEKPYAYQNTESGNSYYYQPSEHSTASDNNTSNLAQSDSYQYQYCKNARYHPEEKGYSTQALGTSVYAKKHGAQQYNKY